MDRFRNYGFAFFWLSYWADLPAFSIPPLLQEVCTNPAAHGHAIRDKLSAHEMIAVDDKI
jgi:hypothetical protein